MSADTPYASDSAWFFVDRARARLVAVPALRGAEGAARVALYRRASKERLEVWSIDAERGLLEIDLTIYERLHDFGVRLEAEISGRWLSVGGIEALVPSPDTEVHCITPMQWGISRACIVTVRDPQRRKNVYRAVVDAGDALVRVLDFTDGRKLQLDFHELPKAGNSVGPRILPIIRLVPHAQRGVADPRPVFVVDRLKASRRRDVVLSPVELAPAGRGGLATNGAIGAWESDVPIVEAMEFVLGRQRYQFSPCPEGRLRELQEPVIYGGPPHASWGHFLTQGLSRLWYAKRYPEVPIIWDAPRLEDYQRRVLDVLEITNPNIFLTEPIRAAEVVFPYPGLSLGDYVLPDFAREIATWPRSAVVPGKRLLLSRSRLGHARGALASGNDSRDLESVAAAHGFAPFAPEEYSLEEQLGELSTAESVLGVEGSAFHTLLLMQDPIETHFWALTRHRGGSGVFQHIKDAKGLRYNTLNFLRHTKGGAGAAIDIDLDALDRALSLTDGLQTNLGVLEPHIERPAANQTNFEAHIANTQVRLSDLEADLSAATRALRRKDLPTASRIIASYV